MCVTMDENISLYYARAQINTEYKRRQFSYHYTTELHIGDWLSNAMVFLLLIFCAFFYYFLFIAIP